MEIFTNIMKQSTVDNHWQFEDISPPEFIDLQLEVQNLRQQIADNMSSIMAAKEKSISTALIIHQKIDNDVDALLVTIENYRKQGHTNVESRTGNELDHLERHRQVLETCMEWCNGLNEKIERHCEIEAEIDKPSIVRKVLDSIVNQSNSTRANIRDLRRHTTSVGPVILKSTRFDELSAYLNRKNLYSVSNKSNSRTIPVRDDCLVSLLGTLNRLGYCERCYAPLARFASDCEVANDSRVPDRVNASRAVCSACGAKQTGNFFEDSINRNIEDIIPCQHHEMSYRPGGLAMLSTSRSKLLFISDSVRRKIHVHHSESGAYIRSLSLDEDACPCSLAVVPLFSSDHDLLLVIAHCHDNRVQIIDAASGEILKNLAITGVACPSGVAVLMTGSAHLPGFRLFVSEGVRHRVLEFDSHAMERVNSFGELGSESDKLKHPTTLAVLANTNLDNQPESLLFVCDNGNKRIQVVDVKTGGFVNTIGVNVLQWPFGVALTSSAMCTQHLLVVSDYGYHRNFTGYFYLKPSQDSICGGWVKTVNSQGLRT